MRTTIHISVRTTPRLYDELMSIHPMGGKISKQSFSATLPGEACEISELVSAIEKCGFRRWSGWNKIDRAREFVYRVLPIWEELDFANCLLVRMSPHLRGIDYGRDGAGRLRLGAGEYPAREPAFGLSRGYLCIHARTHRSLLRANFVGLEFKPSVRVGGAELVKDKNVLPWKHAEDRFWELSSSLEMPRASPSTQLVNDRREPIVGDDFSAGCHVDADAHAMPTAKLLRYARRHIEQMAPFDLAQTREPFGIGKLTDERSYIVSARLRKFCISENWEVFWEPVILE
jgi:hypothetical protein